MSNPTLNPSVLNQAKSMMGLKPTDSITTEKLAELSHADRVRILSFMKTAGDMEKIDSVVALGKNLRAQSLMADVAENPVSAEDPFIQSPAMTDALSAMATGNGRVLKNNRAGEGVTLDTIQNLSDDGLVPGWFGREAEAIKQGETTDLQGVAIGPSGVRLLPQDSTEHQQLFDIPGNRKPSPEGRPRFGPGGEWEAYIDRDEIVVPKSLYDQLVEEFEANGVVPTTLAEAKAAFAEGGPLPGPGPLFQLIPGLDFGAKETDYIASAFVGNFLIALRRLPPELLASAISDPVQFTRDLMAFPFEQAAELSAASSKMFPSQRKTDIMPSSEVQDYLEEFKGQSPEIEPDTRQRIRARDLPGTLSREEVEARIPSYVKVNRKYTPEEQEEAIQSLFNSGALGVAFLASMGIKPVRGALKRAKVEKAVTELKTGAKQAERFAEITKEVKPEELAKIEAEEGVITGKEKPEPVSRETKPEPTKPKRVKPSKEAKPEKELAEVEAFEEQPKKPAPTKEQFKKTATGKALSGEGTIKIDAETGLPTYLRKPPEGFFSQVLAASRVVRATIRWDALNKGTKGRFTREIEAEIARDKIQVSDIRNVHEGTHELGHALDHFLNTTLEVEGKRFKVGKVSEFTLTDRFGTTFAGKKVSNRQLRSEASQVSFHYRPTEGPMTKTHARYRNRGTEMMADFNAMYILDPVKTRALAPTLTAMFEKKLETQPTVKALIEELHAGNVSPRIEGKSGLIEIVAPDPARTKTLRKLSQKDPIVREAVRQLIPDTDTRIKQESMRAQRSVEEAKGKFNLTEDQARDVGAAAEGIGNIFKAGDSVEAVKSRMTPDMNKALNWYRSHIELQRQGVNEFLSGLEGEALIEFYRDYLPHFTVFEGPAKLGAKLETLRKTSPAFHRREIPTYKELVDAGFTPLTTDIFKLSQMWAETNWRYAATREMVGNLKNMTDSFGHKLVLPKKDAPAYYVTVDSPIFKRMTEVATKDGKKVRYQEDLALHPELARHMRGFLDTNPFSDSKFLRGVQRFNAWAKTTNLLFSLFHNVALTESANAVIKGSPISGLFLMKGIDPTTKLPVTGATMPHRIGKKLLKIPENVDEMIASRLQIGSPVIDLRVGIIERDLLSLEAKMAEVRGRNPNVVKNGLFKVAEQAAMRARKFIVASSKLLFEEYHTPLKAYSFYDIFQKELRRNPNMSPEAMKQVKRTIAERLNNAYGGQDWLTQYWLNPRMKRVVELGLLAPDWTISNIKVAATSFSLADKTFNVGGKEIPLGITLAKDPVTRRFQISYWRRMAMTLTGASLAMQTAIFETFGDESLGDHRFPWENESGHKFDIDVTPIMRTLPSALLDFFSDDGSVYLAEGGRYYTGFGKQAKENFHWMEDPFEEVKRKASPVARIAIEFYEKTNLFGGLDELGDRSSWEYIFDTDDGFVENVANQFTPFSFRGNSFFLAIPLRRGMTFSKARSAYTAMLRNYAEPSLTRQFFSEGVKGVSDYFSSPAYVLNKERFLFGEGSLGGQITDAARANGIDVDKAFDKAMGDVQGFYLGKYAAMMNSSETPSEDEVERLGMIIDRLGIAVNSIVKFHMDDIKFTTPPIEIDIDAASEALILEARGKARRETIKAVEEQK